VPVRMTDRRGAPNGIVLERNVQLLMHGSSNLYGTTYQGGASGYGVLYEVTP
jgi:uncharacterized repeat protein (TIGR03803 family)